MAKKKSNSAETLASYWCPPTDIFDRGVGEPVACVASTFEFDATFFETELLPRFLGLRFDHTENEPTFITEREEKLALTSTAVLVDLNKVDPGQTTLRWDQVPIAVPGKQSIQHSKIVILAWQRLVRIIVGSANLTRPGYRRNREVFATLDFFDNVESLPRRPAEDAIGLLEQILRWSRVPDATRHRTLDTLSAVRSQFASWSTILDDFRPREKPKVHFVATCPAVNKQSSLSTIDQIATLWGSRTASQMTVFTPFVGCPDEQEEKVVQRLATIPRTRDCVGWLVVPQRVADESDPAIRIALPESFGRAWHASFESRGGGRVLAIPQFVKGVDKVNRILHSKVLALENDDRQLLMIGSSNFTPHGMGVGVFNVEANLLFEDAGEESWKRIALPIEWDAWNGVEDVQWDENFEASEDCLDHAAMLPRFFAYAGYSQVSGILKIKLDRSCTEPSEWAVRLKGSDTDELTIFSRLLSQELDTLAHTFPEGSRSANFAALLVEWKDEEGLVRQARLIVSIDSKDDLVALEQFKAFGVDAMIDCLIHGRSLADWQEREWNKRSLGIGMNAALDSLRSVDTSGYLLYQVRRFGRAMVGLSERLERVPLLPTAVRYRLFNDPLGPISIGNALSNANGNKVGLFASMSEEHRLFLHAELLLTVANTSRRIIKESDRKSRQWLRQLIGEVISTLAVAVSSRQALLGASLPTNMEQYVSAAMKDVTDLIGHLPTETAHVG